MNEIIDALKVFSMTEKKPKPLNGGSGSIPEPAAGSASNSFPTLPTHPPLSGVTASVETCSGGSPPFTPDGVQERFAIKGKAGTSTSKATSTPKADELHAAKVKKYVDNWTYGESNDDYPEHSEKIRQTTVQWRPQVELAHLLETAHTKFDSTTTELADIKKNHLAMITWRANEIAHANQLQQRPNLTEEDIAAAEAKFSKTISELAQANMELDK
ncbi:MAG: hypothetical protein L6R41_001068 [Letrouitia leprolyta]|nr:MAG: hypothetical protein L6R41_001068 [Letrouitia leprolyta]